MDKDGTLIEDVPYNVDPHEVRLTEGAGPAIRRLAHEGFRFIVVSNQPGVALGKFPESDLLKVSRKLDVLFKESEGVLEGAYYCPHDRHGIVSFYARECSCRKPQPGLLLQAIRDHDVDVPSSWMIGDILDDVEAGNRAGLRTIFLDNGHETLWRRGPFRHPEVHLNNLKEAAEYICLLKVNG